MTRDQSTDPIPVIPDDDHAAAVRRARRPSATAIVAWLFSNKAALAALAMVASAIFMAGLRAGDFNNRLLQLERQVAALQSSYLDLLVRILGGSP